MGRKGVSKRKKSQVKAAPVSMSNSFPSGIKVEKQPEQVVEKGKAFSKGKKDDRKR